MTDPRAATVDILSDLKAQARAGADVLDRIARMADALQAAIGQDVQPRVEGVFNGAQMLCVFIQSATIISYGLITAGKGWPDAGTGGHSW